MAILERNMITDGLSGRVGDTIYRQRKCGTVAYRSPRPYPQKTPCQLGQQSVFKKSSRLGKLALADPEKKAFFARLARKDQYIYNAAVSYYMTHAEAREKEFKKHFAPTKARPGKQRVGRGVCIASCPFHKTPPYASSSSLPSSPSIFDAPAKSADPLTWALRHAQVQTDAIVKQDETIVLNHYLSDQLDLRPGKNHTGSYNKVTSALGTVYHDVLRGSDNMRIRGFWSTTVNK